MDPDVLTRILHASRWIPKDWTVRAVTDQPAGGGGLLGETKRLAVAFAHDADGSTTLIVKTPSATFPHGILFFEAEARAYESGIFSQAGVSVPRHATITDGPQETMLLLEDLGDSSFRRLEDGCDEVEAIEVIETAANFHAKYWNCLTEWHAWVPDAASTEIAKYCSRSLPHFSSWPPSLRTHAIFVAERLEAMAAALSLGHTTLTHGDFHCANMAFRPRRNASPLTLIDLQLVQRATPMLDIARFIGISLRTEVRRKIEGDLLKSYHSALVGHGVANYDYHRMIDDFRLGLTWNLATPLAVYANHSASRRKSIGDDLPLEQRAVEAMNDWNCLDLVL